MSGQRSTLSGGAALPPEDGVKHELTEWLEAHGARVWWEKANVPGHATFRSEGAADKPDLLVETDALTAAIEVKPGTNSAAVYDAVPQIVRYWRAHIRGEDTYRAAGRRIDPDVFLIATNHAPAGCLYGESEETLHTFDGMSDGAQFAAKRGWIPFAEYGRSKATVRILWRLAKADLKTTDRDDPPGIGALLSTALDGKQNEPKPKALHYVNGNQYWRAVA